MSKLDGLDDFFVAFESLTQANFIVRLKQEQSNIRRILVRIHTIRDLDNPFGYYEGASAEDVSLKPLDDLIAHLRPLSGEVPPSDAAAGGRSLLPLGTPDSA